MNQNDQMLREALQRAFNLGQRYWQQVDSDYQSEHKKADETYQKYKQLVEDTTQALNHVSDTSKMVDHAGDANKIANAPGALRLADRILIADEYERRFRQIDLINSRLISENEQLNADMQELVKVAHDFDEALGELGIHCECGLRDCRTTRLRAVLVKHGGTS